MDNGRSRLVTLRVTSVFPLLLLPVIALLTGIVVPLLLWGKNFPVLEAIAALVLGSMAAAYFSTNTLFIRQNGSVKKGWCTIAFLFGFEIIILVILLTQIQPAKPYDRNTVKLQTRFHPVIDVTGRWRGQWTDPRKNFHETITLELTQTGNSISGSIHAGPRVFLIHEGTISGDDIDLYYAPKSEFRDGWATLQGTLKNGEITGKYYTHSSPKIGWASTGTWNAAVFFVASDESITKRVSGKWTGFWTNPVSQQVEECTLILDVPDTNTKGTLQTPSGVNYEITEVDISGYNITLNYNALSYVDSKHAGVLRGVIDNDVFNMNGRASSHQETLDEHHLPWRFKRVE